MQQSLMNLRKLRHLITLAEHQSYVSAARELNLSPSALSRSIQSLEQEMDIVLFTRGKGGVFKTPAGTKVVNAAHALMENLVDLQNSLSVLSEAELGNVTFGIGPLPGSVLLPPLFRETLAEQKLRMHVDVGSGIRLVELLNAGRIEFFLCAQGAVGRIPHLTVEPIASIPVCYLVRSGHPLAGKTGISRAEFQSCPLVGGTFESNVRLGIYADPPYDPAISCDNYQILVDAVRGSDARCPFPETLWSEGLVRLDCAPGVHPERLSVVLCRLRSRRLSAPAAVVLQRIRTIIDTLDLAPVPEGATQSEVTNVLEF